MQHLRRDSTLDFDFNYKPTPAKVLLEVENLSFGYTPDTILFENISFTLEKGQCLAIIGKNGKGKSTLLNNIAGELTPLSGKVTSHPSTTFGHFGQTNINRLETKNTIVDEIYRVNPKLPYSTVRAICGAMMFSGDDADKLVSLLSGGEKSRVMLGQILGKELNLLFLDEPTNHLDMESIESLITAITRFEGSVIIVTHSEELLRRVADRLIVYTSNGAELFDDTYDMFLEKMGWEEEEQTGKAAPKKNRQENKKLRATLIQAKGKAIGPIKKELEKLEASIIKLEDELKKDHEALTKASNNQESSEVIDISKKIATKEQKIEESFLRLETLHEELDKLTLEYDTKLQELE
jgi:ATP-binding cassette subfamily F protein 3